MSENEEQRPSYHRKIDLTDKDNLEIKTATLELTHRDDLYNMRNHTIENHVTEGAEVSTDKWLMIIDKLAEEGVEEVTLTGGEPTLRSDFHTILQYSINTFGRGKVTVQTNGTTDKVLSDYDCQVAVEIEATDPLFNNSIRRMTNPEKYEFDADTGAVTQKKGGKCSYCGKQLANTNGVRQHVKHNHAKQAIIDINNALKDAGRSPVEGWKGLKNLVMNEPNFKWQYFAENQYSYKEVDNSLKRAMQKIENIDNDTVLRVTLHNSNDIGEVMAVAEKFGVNTVFVPLKPVGMAKEKLMNQVPSSGRMKDAITKVFDIDDILSTNHRVDTPMFEAYRLKRERESARIKYDTEEEMKQYWKQGRVSDIGVSTLNVLPDGGITPSPFIRGDKHVLGNMLEDDWREVMKSMAEFNNEVNQLIDGSTETNFDLRQPSITADLDVILNHPYKNS